MRAVHGECWEGKDSPVCLKVGSVRVSVCSQFCHENVTKAFVFSCSFNPPIGGSENEQVFQDLRFGLRGCDLPRARSAARRRGPDGGQEVARLQGHQRRFREREVRRFRYAEQPHDALGRRVQAFLPGRENRDRGQRLLDGSSGAHRRHLELRPDVARHEIEGSGRFREEVRLQAGPHPRRRGRPGRFSRTRTTR